MIQRIKGQYVVYERAARDEERLFIQTAKEVIEEMEEPERKRGPKKHPGGRPIVYSFKPMLLVLLLMVYHRKEYREMEAHLKSNAHLLKELGLKKAPSKSSIHRAASRVSVANLVKLNDAIVSKFKKSRSSAEEARGSGLLRPWDKEEFPMVHDTHTLKPIKEERL